MMKIKKTILILTGLIMLAGCADPNTVKTGSDTAGPQKSDTPYGDETMTISDIVINTSVRKTGQYPENIVITLDSELPDNISSELTADDFAMEGHADSWMDPKLHEFTAAFGQVSAEGNTITLYPENFPEKFFFVKDFKVLCKKIPALSFTYEDVSKVVTPVADDFAWITKEEGGFDYRLFTPESTGKMPVVIVFHGYADTDNLLTYRTAVAWAEPENQKKRPCYVIAPIIDDRAYYTEQGRDEVFEKLKSLLDEMISDGRIDPDRIYLSGNSFGGMSSIEFAEKYPDMAAGILAMCPALNYSPRASADIEKIKDIPIRFAQAEHDGTIPIAGTRAACEKLKSAGAVDADLKEYTDNEMNAAGAEPSNEATYSYHHVELAVMEDESYMQWLYEQ